MARTKPTLFEQIKDEVREERPRRSWTTSPVVRVLIIVITITAVAMFFPGRSGDTQRTVFDGSLLGTVWTEETIVADYPYPVLKPDDVLETQQAAARKEAPFVFVPDGNATETATAQLRYISRGVSDGIDSNSRLGSSLRDRIQYLSTPSRRQLGAILDNRGPAIIGSVYSTGYINIDDATIPGDVLTVRPTPSTERIVPVSSIVDSAGCALFIGDRLAALPDDLQALATDLLMAAMKPNLRYDAGLTERARDEAALAVPTTQEIVQKGDMVVRKGMRVDQRALARLVSYRDAEYARSNTRFSVLVIVGSLAHSAVIISILILYLYFMRRHSFNRNGQLASLCLLPVLTAGMGWLSVNLHTDLPLEYAIVIPAMSMLISVLYEARTAFVVTLVMAFTVSGVRGNDYPAAIVLLIAGMLAAYSVTRIQSRTQIFTSILSIFIGIVVTILAVDLERSTPGSLLLEKLILGTVNAVLSPLLTFAAIILLERVFNVATDLRLDEFDNLTHPLLQQLNERAPGTYQHTLAVARLSEAAASAIGANPLLAKVGALFHDIGKLEKSEYFVENQIDIDNKHDKLPPKKSAAIIRQHIQDGIELAKQYKVPERIWKFVPMHHGTILIKHFYAKALDESLLKETTVDEQDYRYPGPRPDSKETAIVMLADATEALSRLVTSGQREDLERAVDKIVMERFMDGQLDNTPLTMKDLQLIKESFVRNLIGSSHQRVRYKEVNSPQDNTAPSA